MPSLSPDPLTEKKTHFVVGQRQLWSYRFQQLHLRKCTFFLKLILSNIQVHFASHFDEVFDVAFAEKVPGQL